MSRLHLLGRAALAAAMLFFVVVVVNAVEADGHVWTNLTLTCASFLLAVVFIAADELNTPHAP